MRIRPARWPEDAAQFAAFDTSFTTDRVYRVSHTEDSFVLHEEPVNPPLRKVSPLAHVVEALPPMDQVIVAELEGRLIGFAAVKYEAWNRRAVLWHLYVASQHRGCGIGRALLNEVLAFARSTGARCVWLETQTINYAAIQLYRRVGFRLCGLDESLYEPQSPGGEVALFFVRELAGGAGERPSQEVGEPVRSRPNNPLQADWNPAQFLAPQSILSSPCLRASLVLGSSG